MTLVLIAAGALLSSCGREIERTRPPISVQPAPSPVSALPAVAVKPPLESATDREETVPPDLEVSPLDTLVTPGQTIEFEVRTTSDVTRLSLSDGRDGPLAFVREPGTDRWTVTYRVPLRPRVERWGVSITARTDANRWRRVWIFLHARDETESAKGTVP